MGALVGAPLQARPRLTVWDDPASGTLDNRTRAWLESTAVHCHNPDGPRTRDSTCSPPNAPDLIRHFQDTGAPRLGSGGRPDDIVPGQPDQSILAYRIASTHPGVMMPELGKRLVHEEGVALVRQWIAAMPNPSQTNKPSGPGTGQ